MFCKFWLCDFEMVISAEGCFMHLVLSHRLAATKGLRHFVLSHRLAATKVLRHAKDKKDLLMVTKMHRGREHVGSSARYDIIEETVNFF